VIVGLQLYEFVQENESLRVILEQRALLYQKNKAVGDNAMEEIELGPMYVMKYDKALKEGIVVNMQYPEKM
jgi:RecA/RadA recombinase